MQTRVIIYIEGRQVGEDALGTWKPLTQRVAVRIHPTETPTEAIENAIEELRSQIQRNKLRMEIKRENECSEDANDSKRNDGVTDCGNGQYVLGE